MAPTTTIPRGRAQGREMTTTTGPAEDPDWEMPRQPDVVPGSDPAKMMHLARARGADWVLTATATVQPEEAHAWDLSPVVAPTMTKMHTDLMAPGEGRVLEDLGRVLNTGLTMMKTAPTAPGGVPTLTGLAEARDSEAQMTMMTGLTLARGHNMVAQDQERTLTTLDRMVRGEDPDLEDLATMMTTTWAHERVPGLEVPNQETMMIALALMDPEEDPGSEARDQATIQATMVLMVPGEVPSSEARDQATIQATTVLMVPGEVPDLDQVATAKMTTALVQVAQERAPDLEALTLGTARTWDQTAPGEDPVSTVPMAQGRDHGWAQELMMTA